MIVAALEPARECAASWPGATRNAMWSQWESCDATRTAAELWVALVTVVATGLSGDAWAAVASRGSDLAVIRTLLEAAARRLMAGTATSRQAATANEKKAEVNMGATMMQIAVVVTAEMAAEAGVAMGRAVAHVAKAGALVASTATAAATAASMEVGAGAYAVEAATEAAGPAAMSTNADVSSRNHHRTRNSPPPQHGAST
mmetsp:Transcript_38338/g.63450  ORF Transcript_38338/g.63450 Transcript_38338/m.63450 type:complete len:201 (+) Transcript_38338:1671-2273(+)